MSLRLEQAANLVLMEDFDGFVSIGHGMFYDGVKRAVDIAGALAGMMLLLPVAVVVKIAYMATGDFDSIFFVQDRIGKGGKTFRLYKFRSMVPDADKVLKRMLRENKEMREEYQEMRKLTNDPRITKMGGILRKSSLDELPQVINILKGDMSIVGCRPFLPREQRSMLSYYDDIITVKPGLTGFWQVSLRSRGTFKERLKMEKFYAKNCSLKFDAKILWKTFIAVINDEGAK